jgi:aminoglycoside phosphotransferase (APT) family kinase protein
VENSCRSQASDGADSVAAVTAPGPDADALAQCVEPVLRERPRIESVRRLSGGASRETWSFDAVSADGIRHGFVLRRDPGEHVGQLERTAEYSVLQAAATAGVPVPRVVALLEPDLGLGRGFVMERVDGETIPRRILRDDEYATARSRMTAQCGQIAARIHAADPSTLPELPRLAAADQIAQQRELLDALGEAHPAFELGLRWLEQRRPTPTRSAPARLVHGDFRNGNFIVGPDGIRAVLDWELAHMGEPAEDLGWLCVRSWRFGVTDRIVGGFGDLDELLAAYEQAGGCALDPEAVRFWIALGTIKWGVICIAQAFTHLDGRVRSVELAALGRRVAEMEWDLLELMDGRW